MKVAPGVRVRASSRGLRVGVGPRIARVHVGAGRTGISSGVGPFSVYQAIGTTRRHTSGSGSTRRPSQAALQQQAAAARRARADAEKAREAQRLGAIFTEILNLHRHDFAPVERPIAALPELPDPALVRDWHEKNALRGVGLFNRAGRAAARQAAAATAQAELTARWHQVQAEQARAQAELDAQWARLTSNDPDTVLATLTEAFEENETAAVAIGIDRAEVTLAVLVPAEDAVPERLPDKTPAGNLTLRKLSKGERVSCYVLLVAGHTLVTLRETFAVAPGVDSARVVAVRAAAPGASGTPYLECMLAGTWTRDAFEGVRWAESDAANILRTTSAELLLNVRRGQLLPIDLAAEPEIAAFVASIDTTELLAGD